jgi:hypothetical protein
MRTHSIRYTITVYRMQHGFQHLVTAAYDRIGELNFKDEGSIPIIILCYVQNQSIKGHDNFVLISNDTLDGIQTDIYYHSSMSRHVGIVAIFSLGWANSHITIVMHVNVFRLKVTWSLMNKTVLLAIATWQCLPLKKQIVRHWLPRYRIGVNATVTSHSTAIKRNKIPENNRKTIAQIAQR